MNTKSLQHALSLTILLSPLPAYAEFDIYFEPIPSYTSITNVRQLQGTADLIFTDTMDGPSGFTVSATLSQEIWSDTIELTSGINYTLNISGVDGFNSSPITPYTLEFGITDGVSTGQFEYYTFGGTTTLEDAFLNLTQWNTEDLLYLSSAFNDPLLMLMTGDGDGDGLSGARTLIEGGLAVTVNYQLSAVPVPAAAWLFGSGLIALAGFSRRRYSGK